MIHSVIITVGYVGTARAIRVVRAVGGALLIGVGGTLLVAIIVIRAVGMIRRPTILLSTVVWAAEDLVWQSNVLHARGFVWRLRIRRESLAFVRREGIRGSVLR